MDTAVALDKKHPASDRSQRGLDWFAFFLADIQTGWGPFVAAYLTSANWTQLDIGLILTIGTLGAMVLQIPIGALVDHVRSKRLLAAVAVAAISGSALLLAMWPTFSVVLGAKLLHAIASCLAGPVLAAISLGLVGHALLGSRLGRNARFLSLGNAVAAGVMGGVAYYSSNQAIFFLTAAVGIPALMALAQIRSADIDPELARGGTNEQNFRRRFDTLAGLASNRPLLTFSLAIVLFQLSNAPMLPIMAGFSNKPSAAMGYCDHRNLHSRAAVRGCNHRPLGRTHGPKLGPTSSPYVVFFTVVHSQRRVLCLDRTLRNRRGSTPRWHFGGDAWCPGATRHCRHHTRDRAFQFRARRGGGRCRAWRFFRHHNCWLYRRHVWRRCRVFVSWVCRSIRSLASACTHARNASSAGRHARR